MFSYELIIQVVKWQTRLLFLHKYAEIFKTIIDVESFQYKELILLLQEVVEPVVFLHSQNLWLILREVRSEDTEKCTNYAKGTMYAWLGF